MAVRVPWWVVQGCCLVQGHRVGLSCVCCLYLKPVRVRVLCCLKYVDQVAVNTDICTTCCAGTYTREAGRSACTACGDNTWAVVTGAGNCSACPSHSLMNSTGASNISDCVCCACFRLERAPH